MIRGNLYVYDKALAAARRRARSGASRATMIAENRAQLGVRGAVDRVAGGRRRARAAGAARAQRGYGGPAWTRRVRAVARVPRLAPPMLRWRQHEPIRARAVAAGRPRSARCKGRGMSGRSAYRSSAR